MEDIYGVNQVDTKRETDRKCPDCGGAMVFDPATGGLLCPYCGHTEAIAGGEAAPRAQELDISSAKFTGNCDWGTAKKTVICKSCGAQSVYDALQVSDVCPYCGSNQVMEEAAVDTLAPNGVCPFKVTHEAAGENFKKWIKGRLFCPSVAKKNASPDAFSGVYLPYWTFDADTVSNYRGEYGKNRTVRDSEGHTRTVTDWYPTAGVYGRKVDDWLIAGTERYDKSAMSQIEPFDCTAPFAYRPEYVAGFVSERYSVGIKDGFAKAQSGIRNMLQEEIRREIRAQHHADDARVGSFSTEYSNVTYKYVMLPVWLSAFKFKEKLYRFMVNGQTGRVGGKTPVSAIRVILAILIGIAALVGIVWLFGNCG